MEISNRPFDELIQQILRFVDYDIYKGVYVNPEEPDFAKEQIELLNDMAEEFILKNNEN
jgi:hypothetical protein